MDAPTKLLAFLFTDIVGSSKIWEKFPNAAGEVIARHDAIMRQAADRHEGRVFKTVGDAFCIAFPTAVSALTAALEVQRTLASQDWGAVGTLRVRIGIHAGPAELRDNDYFGSTLNRTARIEAAAHGGQILLSQGAVELVQHDAPEGIAFKSLGEHRLRNLERPEFLFQAVAEGLETDFPPPKSMEVLPNNLPVQVTSFIGREVEIVEVQRRLEKARLLTLIGTGGTGKTRLALEVGALLIQEFRDGVWLVELAAVSDPARVPEILAGVLGIRDEPERSLRQTVIQFLRGKTALLIVDNCEHLIGPVSTLFSEILRACPQVKILATSRHSIGISGESMMAVPPLKMFDIRLEELHGVDMVERLSQYEAVRLFIARAVAVRSDFVVTNANAPAVAEICSRLDGIPLAIELAAARIRLLNVEQIAARLSDRFRFLRGGSRTGLPHQQTLEALIDWSHDLLEDDEKKLFRRLGIFVGGRSLEALEAVCPGDGLEQFEVLDLLQQLVEKSLVAVESDSRGDPRYTMTESVWQYSCDRLEVAGETECMRDRHLDYYLEWAERTYPLFYGANQKEWLERFSDERFNFREALTHSLRSDAGVRKGLRMLWGIVRPIEVRGNLAAVRGIYEQLLTHAAAAPRDLIRARALSAAGRLSWAEDRYKQARVYYEEALSIFTELGDRGGMAIASALSGFLHRGAQELEKAQECFEFALRTGKELSDNHIIAISLSGLGTLAIDNGNAAEGHRLKEESLTIYRTVGDRWVIGYILWGITRSAISVQDYPRAREALNEWMEIARDLGNRWAIPYLLETYAELALAAGQLRRAAELAGAAERQREHFGTLLSTVEQIDHDGMVARLKHSLEARVLEQSWATGRESAPWEELAIAAREQASAPAQKVANYI